MNHWFSPRVMDNTGRSRDLLPAASHPSLHPHKSDHKSELSAANRIPEIAHGPRSKFPGHYLLFKTLLIVYSTIHLLDDHYIWIPVSI